MKTKLSEMDYWIQQRAEKIKLKDGTKREKLEDRICL
jgi:hypothetical protein